MTNTTIEITEDEFDDRYPLVVNHLNPNAGWCFGDGRGCLFETYGEELAFVRRQDPCTVWTLVDGDEGDQYLTSGMHFVNRIGYLVSTVAVPEGTDIEVRIPMQEAPTSEADEQVAGMTAPDPRLSEIARAHLGIETLLTRNSDALDFHDVSVWAVESALTAAFHAGAKSILPHPASNDPELPTRFDAYEIAPCRRFREDGERDRFYYETCMPEEADVWTLYGHIPGQGVEAIGDFESCELAEQVYGRITGEPYGR